MGGFSGSANLDGVEAYDPFTDTWALLPAPKPTPSSPPTPAESVKPCARLLFPGSQQAVHEDRNVLRVVDAVAIHVGAVVVGTIEQGVEEDRDVAALAGT